MKPSTLRHSFILAAGSSLLAISSASAQTWDGGGENTNWSTDLNWSPDGAPASGASITFAGTVSPTNVNNLTADISVNAINFTNSTAGQAFSISGARITLGGNITTTASSGAGITDTVSLAMILDANRTITTNTLHNLTLSGILSETGGTRSLTKEGAGTLTLGAQNTYTGGTTVNGGTLTLGAAADGSGIGTLRGTLTINSGATVSTSAVNALGWSGNRVTTLNINGGTFSSTAAGDQGWGIAINLTGGTLRSNSGTSSTTTNQLFSLGGNSSINSLASATTSNVQGRIILREGNTDNQLVFNVADGDAATDLLVSAAITQSASGFGITKGGAGTMQLSALNTFTGNINITGGTLVASAANTSGTNTNLGSRAAGRTINIGTGATLSMTSNNIFGGSGMTAATMPGIVINGGTMSATRYNAIGNVTLNGATLSQSSTDGGAYEGYQFLGSVTVGGSAASTISTGNGKGNHLLGGGTTTFTVADATGDSAADLVVSAPLLNGSGDYTGTAGLIKAGAGTMSLTAANTYGGTTTINAGTLSAGNIVVSGGSSHLGNASSAVTLGSAGAQGTLSYTGNTATYVRGFTIGGAGGGRLDVTTSGQTLTLGTAGVTGTGLFTVGGAGNTTINTNLTHTGGLTKTGAGTLTLAGGNTYTGGTQIDNGILELGHATDTLANGGAVNVNGGTLAIGANSDTVGAVTLTSGSITGSDGTLTGTGSAYDVRSGSVSAKLGGSVGLTKTTDGIVTLSGVNSYTGATNVNTGTLIISSTGSTHASSAVSVASGAALGGDGTVGGDGTFNNGSIFAWNLSVTTPSNPSSATVADTFAVTGNLVDGDASGGSVLKILLAGTQTFADPFWTASQSWSNVLSSGNSVALQNLFTSFSYANGSGGLAAPTSYGSFSLSGSTLNWTAVPEPTSALAGLLLTAGILRRRRK